MPSGQLPSGLRCGTRPARRPDPNPCRRSRGSRLGRVRPRRDPGSPSEPLAVGRPVRRTRPRRSGTVVRPVRRRIVAMYARPDARAASNGACRTRAPSRRRSTKATRRLGDIATLAFERRADRHAAEDDPPRIEAGGADVRCPSPFSSIEATRRPADADRPDSSSTRLHAIDISESSAGTHACHIRPLAPTGVVTDHPGPGAAVVVCPVSNLGSPHGPSRRMTLQTIRTSTAHRAASM